MTFPPPLSNYPEAPGDSLLHVLGQRIAQEPLNLAVTLLFMLALVHTLLAPTVKEKAGQFSGWRREVLHLGGEVELIFGLWLIPLVLLLIAQKGTAVTAHYLAHGVDYAEPLFVVVMMAMASLRPVLMTVERWLGFWAGDSPVRWWWLLLTLGPLLGSLITEPAAMTLCALVLGREFYQRQPSLTFRYATLALLFVNISVGGTLTPFAAPPILLVIPAWHWDTAYLFWNFGLRAITGIVLSNALYFFWFRREFSKLGHRPSPDQGAAVPGWVAIIHFIFLGLTVYLNHEPVLFLALFLVCLLFAFLRGEELALRNPLLVGFFLAALLVHGGLQGWWIQPVLGRLSAGALLLGAAILTAGNDNAAITYLATLVPHWSEALKIAVVSGAVAGGGLTVMANAPNPAGLSLLGVYFPKGVHPLPLLLAALLPTAIMLACFACGRSWFF